MTKTTVTVVGAILALIVLATVVKLQWFPAVREVYFEPDSTQLRQAPAGIVVLRKTHFPGSFARIGHVRDGESLVRTVGRNTPFRDLIAEAYDCHPGHVVLPADAPRGGFDFLVTVSPNPRKQLQSAIAKKLGYVADSETRNTEVLVLRVKDANLPGLTVSAPGENETIKYRDGKLYFQHQPLSVLFKGLEDGLALPIVDQTGLTNSYDFSVIWNDRIVRAMRVGGFHLKGVQKVFTGLGLELEPETTSQEMFIVKKAR
jgi:uncharacterized protein (TIGR03435 family)